MSSAKSLEMILKSLGGDFIGLGEKSFLYGPQGKLLHRNIEALWLGHCVVAPPYNVFLSASDRVSETLTCMRKAESDSLPFGIAVIENIKNAWNIDHCPPNCKLNFQKIARATIVSDADCGKDMFHRKQRERKVWWRKFSRNPSRFSLGEAKKVNKNRDTIDIVANFPFGNMVVETISYQQDAKKFQFQGEEQKEDGLHVIEHMASLDWGCLVMLCDAYEVDDDVPELKLHPKLSPYKVGLYLEQENVNEADPKSHEKSRLVIYLNNLLKSKGLGTVLTRTRRGMENYHVPLTIIVDDASLQNGIIRVKSQLTKISEAVHITDLVRYVAAHCA